MKIKEIFDTPIADLEYDLVTDRYSGYSDFISSLKLPDESRLEVVFTAVPAHDEDSGNAFEVEFKRNGDYRATNTGDAFNVFSIVLNVIRKFLKTKKPNNVYFAALKDETQDNNSRVSLYSRMIKKMAGSVGYSASIHPSPGGVEYQLTRLTK